MFAIIKSGGKQYVVTPGMNLRLEKIETPEKGIVSFDDVLLVADGDNVEIGTPKVKGAKIEAKVVKQGRARKIIILHYRAKKRRKKKAGHRQPFTEVKIISINGKGAEQKTTPAKKTAKPKEKVTA